MLDGSGCRLILEGVTKSFAENRVLHGIDLEIREGGVTAVIGPDGSGKTTLLRIMAGVMEPDEGRVEMWCGKRKLDRNEVGYMPQRFGLYEDLSVLENLKLFAALKGLDPGRDSDRLIEILRFVGLHEYTKRLAGRLSGGMKQKLGLACALITRPKVLILDEPSVGVDPISRRDLWSLVNRICDEGVVVVWSTAYFDEAEKSSTLYILNRGRIIYGGSPDRLTGRVAGRTFVIDIDRTSGSDLLHTLITERVRDCTIRGGVLRVVSSTKEPPIDGMKRVSPTLEDAVMDLFGGVSGLKIQSLASVEKKKDRKSVIRAERLTKKFGDFVAVDGISFEVKSGEIFGLLGPNGAGKSTTFRMLCGLLKPTSGSARVLEVDMLRSPSEARRRIGYMAQKFSLYGSLSVLDNLRFFGGVYGLVSRELERAMERVIEEFQLKDVLMRRADELSLGFKQRLSMACSVIHDPPIIFLDEPTSGVDPLTRREFWLKINSMVEGGISVLITTHFMEEAEYCDRVALMYAGRIIALDTPENIKEGVKSKENPEPTLEDAFITLMQKRDAG